MFYLLFIFKKNMIPYGITGVRLYNRGMGINTNIQPVTKVIMPHKTGDRSSALATFTINTIDDTKINKKNI